MACSCGESFFGATLCSAVRDVKDRKKFTRLPAGAVLGIAEAIRGGKYPTTAVAPRTPKFSLCYVTTCLKHPLTGMDLVQMLSSDLGEGICNGRV